MSTAQRIKSEITNKINSRSNSIETGICQITGAKKVFDHSTGNLMAFGFDVYGQGYTEAWSCKAVIDAHKEAFYIAIGKQSRS